MNIFALHENPYIAAELMYENHQTKMCLETTQIICTNVEVLMPSSAKLERMNGGRIYKPTHINHPVVIWARESWGNFLWLQAHGARLFSIFEEKHNSQKVHASQEVFYTVCEIFANAEKFMVDEGREKRTQFAQVVPPRYVNDNDPVDAYRQYYLLDKDHVRKPNEEKFEYKLERMGIWNNTHVRH